MSRPNDEVQSVPVDSYFPHLDEPRPCYCCKEPCDYLNSLGFCLYCYEPRHAWCD